MVYMPSVEREPIAGIWGLLEPSSALLFSPLLRTVLLIVLLLPSVWLSFQYFDLTLVNAIMHFWSFCK